MFNKLLKSRKCLTFPLINLQLFKNLLRFMKTALIVENTFIFLHRSQGFMMDLFFFFFELNSRSIV